MTSDAALVAAATDAPADEVPVVTPVRFEQSRPSWIDSDGADVAVLGAARPRLSWQVAAAPRGWRQVRYEVSLRLDEGGEQTAALEGGEQILVPWPFPPLRSRDRAQVRIRVQGDGSWSEWSPWSSAEVSLLDPDDWTATWITPGPGATLNDPAPVIGRTFTVDGVVRRARLHITALGIIDPRINGARVSSDHFTPGWTSYDKLLRFRTYDVTTSLRRGSNRFETAVGNGWYRGRIASLPIHRGEVYGDRLGLLAQLELEYSDGRRVTLGTVHDDAGEWRWAPSRILTNDFYDGQHTDLRSPASPALDRPVEPLAHRVGRIAVATAPPVRELETLAPVLLPTNDGTHLIDFGTNVVGWVRLRVGGASAGTVVTVRHAEVLEGTRLALRPLRSAKATDRYILSGADVELLEPEFTYHGFRYAEVSGVPEDALRSVEAVVLGSALTRTGWFSSSDETLNTLHQNVVNSMVGNFLDIPTDCPQRDERLGWTCDTQVFAPTASTLFDVSAFLDSWLESLALDQLADGTVPAVVPRVFREESALAGWSDAAVIVPWVLYERYGDVGILSRQYPSMTAWVARVASLAGESFLWRGGPQLGDWLDPLAPPDRPAAAQADPDVVATASYFHSVDLLALIAGVLGFHADADRYRLLATRIRTAFCEEYVRPDGRIRSDCQTVYALAITWGLLVDPALRARAGTRLAELVELQGHTVATGFLGTPVVLHALTLAGRTDAAYKMLTTHDFPSWLYAVDHGATTIWERWDSLLRDGSVNPGEMTSFNHYAFGAVANWMHRMIGGLTSLAPACRRVRVAPAPGPGLSSGGIRYDAPYGRIEVSWSLLDGRFSLDLDLPVGVTAVVALPDGTEIGEVEHGHHTFAAPYPTPVG